MYTFMTNLIPEPARFIISYMYELYPYFTNDGSVGLFSPADDDIYHSTYGALTEAYEKFIIPADPEFYLKNNSEIKILDICYGIGYNSKSFLNYFYKNFYTKNNNIAPIYTNNINIDNYSDKLYSDNIYVDKSSICNSEIYGDNALCKKTACSKIENKNFKIYIKAIDTDKILAFLSPFIICNKKRLPKNYKLPFDNEKIAKMLNKPSKSKIEFSDIINIIFFEKIVQKYPEIYENEDINAILSAKKYRPFFEPFICHLFEFYKSGGDKNTLIGRLEAFLHNIYYHHLSNRYKIALNSPILSEFIFDLIIKDAREELLEDKNKYNLIFLDAFTPAKCPALWSVDFFKLLFEHLDENGRILTYSNSAAVRNAFLNAGFFIGKIYNPSSKKYMGTIAVKNKTLIKNELSEYDLGLLKTKAGIFYRDKNLNALNDEIIASHKIEVENSTLLSSSKYIKTHKNKN